jgi:biopolymer transport protein ExbD
VRFLRKKRRKTPTVIIVSLIDVLLVVLIFLMVTTTAKKIEPALKLNLPESKEAKAGTTTEDKPFLIFVSTNMPYFYLADQPVTFDKLQSAMTEAVKKNPKVRVEIKADKRAPFGEIVRLIDASKEAQVSSLNFITEKPGKP